jgi:hypothetical protein
MAPKRTMTGGLHRHPIGLEVRLKRTIFPSYKVSLRTTFKDVIFVRHERTKTR